MFYFPFHVNSTTAFGVRIDVNKTVFYEIFSLANKHDPVIFKGDPNGSIDFKWNLKQKTIFFIHGSFLDDIFTSALLNGNSTKIHLPIQNDIKNNHFDFCSVFWSQ